MSGTAGASSSRRSSSSRRHRRLPRRVRALSGATTRSRDGTDGGNGAQIAVFVGASEDGVPGVLQHARADRERRHRQQRRRVRRAIAAGYPRPKGATPSRVPLVLAYRSARRPTASTARPRSAADRSNPSCNPPVQSGLPDGRHRRRERAAPTLGRLRHLHDARREPAARRPTRPTCSSKSASRTCAARRTSGTTRASCRRRRPCA